MASAKKVVLVATCVLTGFKSSLRLNVLFLDSVRREGKGKKRSSRAEWKARVVSASVLLIIAKKGMEERSCHALGCGSKDISPGDLCWCRQLPPSLRCSFPQPYSPISYACKPEIFYGGWKLAAEMEEVG